jgi:hypothetical protein
MPIKCHGEVTPPQLEWLSLITQLTTNAGKDVGEKGKKPFYTLCGNVN